MKINKQINLSAQYTIDGTFIAYFGAQLDEDGQCSTNRGIADQDLYRLNREAVNTAFMEFEDEAYKLSDKIKSEGI